MRIVEGLPPKGSYHKVSIDTELFGLNQKKLHRPAGRFGCLTICPDGKTVYLITKDSDIEKALNRVDRARWVMHNAAFDIRHLRRWTDIAPRKPDKLVDSLLIERILWGGYYDTFALDDLARRYLGIKTEKETRKAFFDPDGVLTSQMKSYAARDAIHTWKFSGSQERFLEKDPDAWKIWSEVDGPALWAVLDFKGFKVDVKKWAALAKKNAAICEELQAKTKFKLSSPKQVLAELNAFGKKKNIPALEFLDSTNAAYLDELRDIPLVATILAFRDAHKRATTYGDNVIRDFVEDDGRIYPSFNITGAETGRMSSSSPNLQNIPAEADYRACYIADIGNLLAIADYKAQEPRLTAAMSKDPVMIEAFENGEDIHMTVAREIANALGGEPDRKLGKAMGLASTYGMSAQGLAAKTGMSLRDSENMIREYFRRFAGVYRWTISQKAFALQHGYVVTLAGRKIWVNPHSRQGTTTNPLNGPIQGGAADQTKRALGLLHKHYGRKIPLVGVIHDEIVAEVKKSDVKPFVKQLEKCMLEASDWLTGGIVPGGVDIHTGKSWAAKG